jgi:hypothetical protein
MNWKRFWLVFLGVQVGGLFLAMFGVLVHFYTVILGMFLLFPGIILTSSWAISHTPITILLATILTITLNVPFWISFLRPISTRG